MYTCSSCGAANADGARFCVKCGAPRYHAPPPESWRYSGDLNQTRVDQQQGTPAGYQPPPASQNFPTHAPPKQPLYQPPPLAATAPPSSGNQTQLAQIGMVMGITVACVMAVGLIPCLGWLNYFTLIFGKIAFILCIVAIATEKNPSLRNKAVIGLVLAGGAWVIGLVRLIIGGGCL